nr:MAG TPA: hypothetical protein [Bacteriophage sp.]
MCAAAKDAAAHRRPNRYFIDNARVRVIGVP